VSDAPTDAAALVRSVTGAIVAGDLPAVLAALHPRFVSHTSGEDVDRAGFCAMLEHLRAAFPDLAARVEIVVTQGDTVAWRTTSAGTHSAEFLGVEATGRRVTWSSLNIAVLAGDRFLEHWGSPDLLGLLLQLRGEA
jgi:predicted ester cyclase